MYKFLNNVEWLSIENAIEPLGAILGGGVKSSNDVLALLFEGKLQGSIHSSSVVAVPLAEMTDVEAKSHRGSKWRKPNGHYMAATSLDDCVILRATNPVLDVPFFCKRAGDIDFFLDAKERHLDVSRNIRVPPGTLVQTPDGDDYFCVLGGSSIPDTFGQIVIRTQAIQEFQSQQIELKEAPAKDTATPAPGGKLWTPENLAELKAYRDTHTMSETAARFVISKQRIRSLLPSQKPKAKPFAGLIHRMK